ERDEHDRAVPEPAQPGDEVAQMLFGEVRARRREIERGHAGDEKREDGELDRSAAIHRGATATTALEAIVTASPFTLSTASSATNMYIKFEEPNFGSSDAPGHKDEIEILSWSHGFVQPTSPTRSGGGEQATRQNLSFTKYLDRSTSDLLKYSWNGKQIGKATI